MTGWLKEGRSLLNSSLSSQQESPLVQGEMPERRPMVPRGGRTGPGEWENNKKREKRAEKRKKGTGKTNVMR